MYHQPALTLFAPSIRQRHPLLSHINSTVLDLPCALTFGLHLYSDCHLILWQFANTCFLFPHCVWRIAVDNHKRALNCSVNSLCSLISAWASVLQLAIENYLSSLPEALRPSSFLFTDCHHDEVFGFYFLQQYAPCA